MKKIAVITSGLLPMPAVKGGAIETLLQYTLDFNEKSGDFNYDVYCIYDEEASVKARIYSKSSFEFIKVNSFLNKIYFNTYRVLRKLGYHDPNFQQLYIREVCKQLKGKGYDFILIESDNHFVLPIKKVTDAPIVLYLHNDKLNDSTRKAKQIADACYKIVTVSDYIKERVCTIKDIDDSKVTTVLNGIDTDKFKLENRDEIRIEYRKKYGIKDDEFVFLFTGRVEPNKGVLELVKAFKKIQSENCKLLILGGSFFSSNHKTRYVKQVQKETEGNHNIIFTGYVNHVDIPKYHIMADCMVTPSQWAEPGSLANQESFASGLPLIASRTGGTPEYTKNTKAILVEKDDDFIINLNLAMEKVMNDKDLHIQMRESQLKVSSYFSKERYCEDLIKYLKKVV